MLLLTGRLPGEKKARAMPDSVGGSETMLGVGLSAVLRDCLEFCVGEQNSVFPKRTCTMKKKQPQ